MNDRLLELHASHGNNVRFYPGAEPNPNDVNVDNNDKDDDSVNKAIKDSEKADLENNAEFNKVQQRADQEAANAAKARDATTEAQAELETANTEKTTMKAELDDLRAKAATKGIELGSIAEDDLEPNEKLLLNSIKQLDEKLNANATQISSLQKDKEDLLSQGRKDKAGDAQNKMYQELLTDLDGEYGAEHRNVAVGEFEDLCKTGKVPRDNTAKSTRILEGCYKNAVKAKTTVKKEEPHPLDSGSGGGSGGNLAGHDLKEGSLDEVAAQVK